MKKIHIPVALFILALGTNAMAVTVNVDPGVYPGAYNVAGSGYVTGTSSVDLSQGTHSILISGAGSFSLSVDGSGQVTSDNPTAAQGVGNTLVFNTTTVQVDPGSYSFAYKLNAYSPFLTGQQSFIVIPGIPYNLRIGAADTFTFSVDGSDQVTSDNPTAAVGLGNTLVFNTTTLEVDPGTYSFAYSVSTDGIFLTGLQTFLVMPGLNFNLRVGAAVPNISFILDSNDQVTTDNPVATQTVGNKIIFNTTTLEVDPGTYSFAYSVSTDGIFLTGLQTFVVMPGLDFSLRVGAAVPNISFILDSNDQVTTDNPVTTQVVGNKIIFNTTTVDVDPGDYPFVYSVSTDGIFVTGLQTFVVMPGLDFRLRVGAALPTVGFIIDGIGQVTTDNPVAAQGGINLINLGNVLVHVDPTTYAGTYNVGGYSGLSGPADVTLVPK